MANLYIFVGLSGSGKSTAAEKMKEDNGGILLSSDTLREEYFGDASVQYTDEWLRKNGMRDVNSSPEWQKKMFANKYIFNEIQKRAKESIEKNKTDVYYDATNVKAKDRANIIKKCQSAHKIAIVSEQSLETCLKRNQERDRNVPEYVIKKQAKDFELPTKEEGFDKIMVLKDGKAEILPEGYSFPEIDYGIDKFMQKYKNQPTLSRDEIIKFATDPDIYRKYNEKDKDFLEKLYSISPIFKDMEGFSQDNPHHDLELLPHILKTTEYAAPDYMKINGSRDYSELKVAALFHDVGKLYSQEIKVDKKTEEPVRDKDGIPIKQFIGHAAVSEKISHPILEKAGFSSEETNRICFYIKNHDLFISYRKTKPNPDFSDKQLLTMENIVNKAMQLEKTTDLELVTNLFYISRADNIAQAEIVYNPDGTIQTTRDEKIENYKEIFNYIEDYKMEKMLNPDKINNYLERILEPQKSNKSSSKESEIFEKVINKQIGNSSLTRSDGKELGDDMTI